MKTKKTEFTTGELTEILRKKGKGRFVIDWIERGIILDDLQPAEGYGSRRMFSYPAVLRAGLALQLQEKFGFNRARMKKILDKLWNEGFFKLWAEAEGTYSWSLILIDTNRGLQTTGFPGPLNDVLTVNLPNLMVSGVSGLEVYDIVGMDVSRVKENIDIEINNLR